MNDNAKPANAGDEEPSNLTPAEKNLLQAWSSAPAPGEDRLARLSLAPPPLIHRPSRQRRARTFAQHFATGALLFLVGYLVGQRHDGVPVQPDAQVASPAPDPQGQIANTPPTTSTEPVSAPDKPTPDTPAEPGPASPRQVASAAAATTASPPPEPTDCQPPQIYKGKDGHFRIDAVLCQSGSRATWVINPDLELANASQSHPKEESHQ